jgi:osmotically-inducible protein OsmY
MLFADSLRDVPPRKISILERRSAAQARRRKGITVMRRIVASMLAATALAAGATPAAANDVAKVPETLRNDPAYSTYAKIQIQLEMLATPSTANLDVVVDSPLPGVIDLRGTAPDPKIKDRLVQTALRISGLRVRQTMRVAPPTDAPAESTIVNPDLTTTVKDTVTALFPELAANVTVSATADGVVTLKGSAPSYEACLLLAQSAKSQPGCRAAVCKLQVPIDPISQKLKVSEDGAAQVYAAQLPAIPTAGAEIPLARDKYTEPRIPAQRMAADDAPPENLADRQILEDVRGRFDRIPELKRANWEVDVQSGVVTLSANTQSRAEVEIATAAASEAANVFKVISKCRPVSIQRSRVRPQTSEATVAPPKPRKLLGFIPFGTTQPAAVGAPVNSWRYRENLRRLIQSRCGSDVQDLTVKATADGKGLLLEGKTATPQKRVSVFKQLDNLAELRNVNYDAVLQIIAKE